MIRNKIGAMKPSSYLLMALAVSLIVVGAYMVIGELKTNYPDVSVNESWESVYLRAKNVTKSVNATTQTLRNATAKMQEGGTWGVVIGGFIMLKILPQMAGLILKGMVGMIDIVIVAFTEAGVPGVVVGVIITALIIIVLFGIISAVWKYREV